MITTKTPFIVAYAIEKTDIVVDREDHDIAVHRCVCHREDRYRGPRGLPRRPALAGGLLSLNGALLCEGRDRRKSLALSSPRRQFLARDGHFSVYPTYQELAKLDRRISARNDHSFAYSAFAAMRMGISGSASFQRVRKSW